MKKKWICTVCGYVHEGDEAPEFCPQCKQPKSKFKELVETEGALQFVDEHVLGVAKGVDPVSLEGLNAQDLKAGEPTPDVASATSPAFLLISPHLYIILYVSRSRGAVQADANSGRRVASRSTIERCRRFFIVRY